jgi:hypothetical protein
LGVVNLVFAAGPYFTVSLDDPTQGTTYLGSFQAIIKLTYVPWMGLESPTSATCYLDGKPYGQISITETTTGTWDNNNPTDHTNSIATGSITLIHLAQGEHTLQVKGSSGLGFKIYGIHVTEVFESQSVSFLFNAGIAPKVSASNLEEYLTDRATLNIITDTPVSVISCILDGQAKLTFPQTQVIQVESQYQYNVTLSGLADGMHILNVYATDSFGNIGSTTTNFKVNKVNTVIPTPTEKATPKPSEISNTAILLSGVIAGAVIVSIALWVIYRKQNLKTKKQPTKEV